MSSNILNLVVSLGKVANNHIFVDQPKQIAVTWNSRISKYLNIPIILIFHSVNERVSE